jgi:esterase/lipase superfamily enzyme
MPKIYFATNRNETGDKLKPFGPRFHKDGPQFYRVGSADVAKVSNDPDTGYVVKGIAIAKEAAKAKNTEEVLGSSEVFKSLQGDMSAEQTDAIVFIHGFANTFETTLQRAAQLQDAYTCSTASSNAARPIKPQLFVFSWPSDGEMCPFWSYRSDRQDAAHSGTAMGRALARLIRFLHDQAPRDPATNIIRCNQRIHLVAHSMGNWALRHALLALRQIMQLERMPRLFEHIFLMAADEDADALGDKNKLGLLMQLGRQVHVYHSLEDRALTISTETKGNGDRLGSMGPKTFVDLPNNIDAIDCVLVDNTDDIDPNLLSSHVNHQYYRLRKEVIDDVCAVLSGKRPETFSWRTVVEPGKRYRITPAAPATRPRKKKQP